MTENVWQDVLKAIEPTVSRPNFVTWLKPTRLIEESPVLFTIAVPNFYAKSWLEGHAMKQIEQILKTHYPQLKDIRIVVVSGDEKSLDELPLLQVTEEEPAPVGPESKQAPKPVSKYTFENFIVGNNNRLAFAASQVVAEKPGEAYNPLFIYGGVGLGKTHLMQAISGSIMTNHPKKKIIYISCETFASEFIDALRAKTMSEFKNKYRQTDVLLVDDIQFLANKEGTQEEFFHTFNMLHQANRQIVITADRLPKEISDLEERLTSRFGWGMVADIQSPNYETRVAILQEKAEQKGVTVPEVVLEYIANTITSNVRELEGSLTMLVTAAQVENEPLTLAFAGRILKDLSKNSGANLSAKKVIQTVAEYFEVEIGDITGKKRVKELVYPRQIVMYLLRELASESYPQIGEALGGRDHTTIMHGTQKIAEKIKKDTSVEHDIQRIKGLLNG